jgi:TIR domain
MKAFVSYSHHDAEFLTSLHQHLAALRREKLLEIWTDREIDAGGMVDEEITAAMEDADLFLLLVSSSFINSDYCYKKEFQKALEKQRAGKALIIPIIVRPCDWGIADLRQFKVLPEDAKAVDSKHWHSRDEAFANIAHGLRALLEKRKKKAEEIQAPDDLAGVGYQQEPTCVAKFGEPSLPFAKELLDLILAHPNEDERGLTEILRDHPEGALHRSFIPNTTASGAVSSVKKSLLSQAVTELLCLGWLLQPEANNAVRIYELNPDSKEAVR